MQNNGSFLAKQAVIFRPISSFRLVTKGENQRKSGFSTLRKERNGNKVGRQKEQ